MNDLENVDTTLLICLSREGDATAIETLIHTYETRLYRLALSMLNNPAEADEAVQDAFVRAIQRLNSYRGEASFGTWLYAVALNVCRERWRTANRDRAGSRSGGVASNGLPASWQSQPLFRLDQNEPPSDLLSVSWLPDSSGLVFVALADGKPELHLAQLNMPAIDYLKSLPSSGVTPAPTVNPSVTSAVSSIAASFWPAPSVPIDESTGFSFGATITATSPISMYAHIGAFVLRPGAVLEDCSTRAVPTDRKFWANQAEFAPGQIIYSQGFAYVNEVPGADRLVVRINLIEPGVNGRLLYCTQQAYPLKADLPMPVTATPLPPTPAPTATPGPALTVTPYEPPVVMPITDRDVAIQLALQADRNLVQRDRPITVELIAADPSIVTVRRFASQAESGFGVNATIVDGPVWVVTIYGRGVVSMIGMAGGTFETNEVSYDFLERTGTLLGTLASQITPPPPPPPTPQPLP